MNVAWNASFEVKTMRKRQRKLKQHYRGLWEHSKEFSVHNLTYPMWLEQELEREYNTVLRLQTLISQKVRQYREFSWYIRDMEKGMQILQRSVDTLKETDGEVVIRALSWLRRTVHTAKDNFEKIDREDRGPK